MLRISGGQLLKNRRLTVPETGEIRPMVERSRVALFSIIGQIFVAGGNILDAFAGSGLLGFEAISRGANHCTYFDLRREHITSIKKHAEEWGVEKLIRGEARDVTKAVQSKGHFRYPDGEPTRLMFLDPPHALSNDPDSEYYRWMEELHEAPTMDKNTLFVFGHHAYLEPPEQIGGLKQYDHRKYAKAAFSLWEIAP